MIEVPYTQLPLGEVRKNPREFSLFLFYGSALHAWERMTARVSQEKTLEFVGCLDLAFSDPEVFSSLVLDLYRHANPNIVQKTQWLRNAPLFLRMILVRVKDPRYNANTLKADLRRIPHPNPPTGSYLTAHSADDPADLLHHLSLLVGGAERAHRVLRPSALPRGEVVAWIQELQAATRRLGISDYCVVGSGPLDICGIRHATDLDIILPLEDREKLGLSGGDRICPEVDVVHPGYHERVREGWMMRMYGGGIPDEELIRNPDLHFTVLGTKFAVLPVIYERKAHDGRAKDRLDLALMSHDPRLKDWRQNGEFVAPW